MMKPPRRRFTKEFKETALMRMGLGVPATEIAQDARVNPKVLYRWRRELVDFGPKAFSGYGKSRASNELRTQTVIFRLTQDEYNRMEAASAKRGACSVSDFARSQVLRANGESSLTKVAEKLNQLAIAVQHLTRALVE